ncbi:MAG: polysaccharide deacetylase family protein [Prevotella sp.]|nr:polysaccharide deacetylase family protein [Prevotella sp.]
MNILTFDVEEWYLEKILHDGRAFRYQQFDEAFAKVLDELDRLNIKATCFCLGKLATDFPQVVREIARRGHEVGCHSNEHVWLNKMNEEQLLKDTQEALKALEDVIGKKVVSYRAPAFSITHQNKWAVNVLADCGIESDASVFPTSRDFGGYKGFPQDTPCIISHEGATLKEYPISLTSILGKTMAYSGGGFFRLLPYWLVSKTIKLRDYNICYFHLNDLIHHRFEFKSKAEYEENFKEPGTLKNRIVRYVKMNIGKGNAYGKLQRLLTEHEFVGIREADELIDWGKMNKVNL